MVGEGDGDGCRSNTLCVLNRNVVVGGVTKLRARCD